MATAMRWVLAGLPRDDCTTIEDLFVRAPISPKVDPVDLLFARGNASLICEVIVDGGTVAPVGRCVGVDLAAIERELREIHRANAGAYTHFLRAWPQFQTSLQHWFETQFACN